MTIGYKVLNILRHLIAYNNILMCINDLLSKIQLSKYQNFISVNTISVFLISPLMY